MAQLMGKHLGEAQTQLDRAINLDPNDADSYYWRGKDLALEGRRAKATQDLETAVTIDPKLGHAFTELATLYSKSGQTKKAAEMQERATSLADSKSPDDIEEFIRNLQNANP
jgi:Tfp pilus assembly protein PilF